MIKFDEFYYGSFDGSQEQRGIIDISYNITLGKYEGGKPIIDVLLSGVSPLTLLNAIRLNYIKAFGKCEQASTPTPTSPVDIVCNNGALKVRHQSGLPIGYQLYEYITASGNQWLDTGVKLASTDIVEVEFQNSSSTGYGALYGVFAAGDSSAFYANGTYYGYDVANGKVDTNVSVNTAWHTLRFDYANGIITLDGNNTTYTPFVFDNAKNNYLFARYYNNSYGYGFKGSCKRFKVIRNNEVICDLIPAKSSFSNAVGMFDLVNNVFHGNVGSGDFTASNPINDLEVYVDGTAETVSIGKGFDDADGQGTFVSPSSSATTRIYKAFGQLPNGKYKVAITGNFELIFQYKNADVPSPSDYGNIDTWTTNGIYDLDKTGYYYGIAIRYPNNGTIRPSDFNGTISLIPVDNSATCQHLLSVDTYKDAQNITNGDITRNVGVVVLDGTEDWEKPASADYFRLDGMFADAIPYDSDNPAIICSHFVGRLPKTSASGMNDKEIKLGYTSTYNRLYLKYYDMTTADDLKQWLADQYNAGTPVIVVYPLATPTTETTTPQSLPIVQGNNIVEATGSLNGLEMEISYKTYDEGE